MDESPIIVQQQLENPPTTTLPLHSFWVSNLAQLGYGHHQDRPKTIMKMLNRWSHQLTDLCNTLFSPKLTPTVTIRNWQSFILWNVRSDSLSHKMQLQDALDKEAARRCVSTHPCVAASPCRTSAWHLRSETVERGRI